MNSLRSLLAAINAIVVIAAFLLTSAANGQQWSIEDNIALRSVAHAGSGGEQFVYADNGAYVAFVVEAPRLTERRIDATLFVYDVSALLRFAAGGPRPEPVFEVTASTNNSDRGIEQLSWISDRSLVFISRETGAAVLRQWRIGEKSAQTLVALPREIIAYKPLSENRIVAFVSRQRTDPTPDAPRVVTGQSFANALLDRSGDPILSMAQIVLIDAQAHTFQLYDAEGVPFYGLEISPDGRYVAVAEQFDAEWVGRCWRSTGTATESPQRASEVRAHQLSIIDLQTGYVRRPFNAPVAAIPVVFSGTTSIARWSPDSTYLVALSTFTADDACGAGTREGGAQAGAYVLPGIGDEQVALHRLHVNENGSMPRFVTDIRWGADSQRISVDVQAAIPRLFFRTGDWSADDTGEVLHFVRLSAGGWYRSSEQPPPPDTTRTPVSQTLVVEQNYDVLPRVYAQAATSTRRILLDLAPGMQRTRLGHAREIAWTDENGHSWTGLVAVPSNYQRGRRYPVVVQTHNFLRAQFFSEGIATSAFPGRAALARGFVVLTIDETDAVLGDRLKEPARVLSVYSSAVEHLVSTGVADPDRIGVIGWSRTSYFVKYALTHAPDLFHAAVVADGVDYGYGQFLLWHETPGNREQYYLTYGGELRANATAWLDEAPGFNLQRVRAPLRIEGYGPDSLAGEWEFYAGLRRLGMPVDLVFFPSGVHSLVRPEDRFVSTGGTLDWLDFWLNGHEDDDPGKTLQYERWRRMRTAQCSQGDTQDHINTERDRSWGCTTSGRAQ